MEYNNKFEIPYNFSKETIIKLIPYQDIIETIYVPAYKGHSRSTRVEFGLDPNTLEEYLEHIKFLQMQGFNISILFQENRLLDRKIIEFYLDKNIKSFIVRDDNTAKLIKTINSNIEVIASITKLLTVKDINTLDLSIYDKIVLDFRLNDINIISKLPKKYKYIIIPNTLCSKDANPKLCQTHWDYGDKLGNKLNCFNSACPNLATIPYNKLYKFDKYISTYKLQGREKYGDSILEDIYLYLNEYLKREPY